MRLIRFGEKGTELPGLWKDGQVVDLRARYPEMPDIGEAFFRGGWLEKAAAIQEPGFEMDVRIGCPIVQSAKLICLGINYSEHKEETGFEKPANPLLFCKTPNALNGPYDPIMMPQTSRQIDWEVELAVIIGREGKQIPGHQAFDYIAGFSVMNDVSGRDVQLSESQWFRGKSFDTFAPLGPAIVTPDEIEDVHNLRLTTEVNGERMQDGNTRDLIFDVPAIIEFISQDITLVPGDVIATGTPSGVGYFREPPILLKAGDTVECTIENIGSIKNEVRDQ
jgi:2-keto-4-pentenoate hydratase/2-oxohepta-3-ene-1,7-dioic acid hydratase in catechol pathway